MEIHTIRVLLVEDNAVECALLRNLIRIATPNRNAEIVETRSLDQAFKRIRKQPFDLIVADLGLEDSRGPQTVLALRNATRDTPIVVVTALDDDESGSAAIGYGAQDYLVKGQISERDLGRAMRFALTRKSIEDGLYQEKERARATLAAIAEAVVTTDANGLIESLNPKAEVLSGWHASEALGQPITTVLSFLEHGTLNQVLHPVEQVLRDATTPSTTGRFLMRTRDSRELTVDASATAIRDRDGKLTGGIVIVHDTTRDYEMLSKFSYQARHDALTGLLNRHEFEHTLSLFCQDAMGNRSRHALLYIDLDRFKTVNDTGGHSAGDELLRQLSIVLRGRLRRTDVLARIGGDEFAILLEHCELPRAESIALEIIRAVGDFRLFWQGGTFSVGASAGVCEITPQHCDAARAMRMADAASLRAKQNGRNTVHVHQWLDDNNDDADRATVDAPKVRELLQSGNGLALFLQHAKLPDGRTAYSEFLLRLTPEGGAPAHPGELLLSAQRLGLSEQLDRWVIDAALTNIQRIAAHGGPLPVFGINVTAATVCNAVAVQDVFSRVRNMGLSPDRICFEINESTLTAHPAQVSEFARALRGRGLSVALDGFSGGGASFEYMRHFPLDYLKVESTLVQKLPEEGFESAVVRAAQAYAAALDIKTIAEGVETSEQQSHAEHSGFHALQGFALHRPEAMAQ